MEDTENDEPLKTELEESTFREFSNRFVLPRDDLWAEFDGALERAPADYRGAAIVFKGNIDSALTVVTIPFTMTYSEFVQSRFQALHMAEKIRALKPFEKPTADDDREAYSTASQRIDQELKTPKFISHLTDMVVQRLVDRSEGGDLKTASHELLLETIVMVWGALETLISGTLRVVLNKDPVIAARLLEDDRTKKHFPSKGISIDSLLSHDFNVAESMGDLLLRDRHFDSLPVIRDMLDVVLPDKGLRDALGSDELWLFWQRRHLIVHRRGHIDEAYLSKTSDKAAVGSRLSLSSRYVDSSLELAVATAAKLLKALSDKYGTSKR
ncbi:hypothetical protein AUC68_03735 [Methyloceanibacter methanicus]|uniref:RiboL-PSP-HEPN domain-containing protein n=1 Tax=Methyloceanibacter methanicus TaxID=1774968 RepID=A0A1E3W0W4_9HYPH|nr:hypothetical protein [Methyloceanibacter methanicus]ODR99151.1 hypothetical protein AUC68_03735 [Methyloceanibacter methanicus]